MRRCTISAIEYQGEEEKYVLAFQWTVATQVIFCNIRRLLPLDGCRTDLNESMYDLIVLRSIPHSFARFLRRPGV
jgi:hypothetical protein